MVEVDHEEAEMMKNFLGRMNLGPSAQSGIDGAGYDSLHGEGDANTRLSIMSHD